MSTTTLDKLIIKGLTEETTAKPILVWNPVTRRVSWQTSPNARIAALEAKLDTNNNFKFIPDPADSYNAGTRVLTMSAGWIGTINGVDYTNANPVVLTAIPLATAGYTRIDLIVFTTNNTFVRVAGNQSTFNAIAPQLPPNTLQATFLTVTNTAVIKNPPPPPTFGSRASQTTSGTVKTDTTVADPVVYVKETVDSLLDAKANFFLDIKNITGITYNVIITDILFQLVYAGTLPMNVIIPNNSTVPFPIGTIFYTLGTNTGIITASGATGVTLSLKAGLSLSAIQNEVRQYTKIGTNTWSVRGDLNLGAVTQTELSYLQGATSNLQAQINAKTALSGGTTNFLMKWLTATTATVSRIWDTGTFLGIGTVNTPTKDLTFGNQANREIGIEESGINSIGKNLKITAGRTVNYIVGSPIVALPGSPAGDSSGANVCGMYVTPTDDIVLVNNSRTIYTKLSGSSTWTASTINVELRGICRASNGNVYGVGNNLIYMQPGGTGNFVSVGAPSRSYTDVCAAPNGNIYACVNNGSIFMQTAGVGTFNDLSQTTRAWTGMCTLSNGNVYAGTYGSGIYMQTAGTGNFVLVQSGVSANKMFSTLTNDVYAISELVGYLSKQTAGTGTFTTISGATTAGSTAWKSGISTSNGDLYFINDIAIYRQEISSAGLPNLDGGDLVMIAGTGKGTGKSTIKFYTGQKSASGTTMQVETLREYIDENGYHIYTSMPVYADNAAALAGGLPLGCEYRTATGIKMIVY